MFQSTTIPSGNNHQDEYSAAPATAWTTNHHPSSSMAQRNERSVQLLQSQHVKEAVASLKECLLDLQTSLSAGPPERTACDTNNNDNSTIPPTTSVSCFTANDPIDPMALTSPDAAFRLYQRAFLLDDNNNNTGSFCWSSNPSQDVITSAVLVYNLALAHHTLALQPSLLVPTTTMTMTTTAESSSSHASSSNTGIIMNTSTSLLAKAARLYTLAGQQLLMMHQHHHHHQQLIQIDHLLAGAAELRFAILNNLGHIYASLYEPQQARVCLEELWRHRDLYLQVVAVEDFCVPPNYQLSAGMA